MGSVQEAMPGLAAGTVPDAARAALLDGARREAMARAGRLLASRPRSEKELGDRLTQAGFEPATVDAVLDRLRTLGLLNDEDFALQWIEERAARKSSSARALVHELRAKGVAADVAEAALARAGLDEEAQAIGLAARYVRRVASKPLAEQFTRIHQMLTRRGYSGETAETAARAVLPPDGWD
ncbi:MAG: recombination regulator RecX [Actinomycetota bacterium]|nr:recombination regulator RecX [Actinomycetota bacterium]